MGWDGPLRRGHRRHSGGVAGTAIAGDLLRGGYSSGSQSGSSFPGSFSPPSVAQARQNAEDMLARTTRAMTAVNTMQQAARKLAVAGANSLIAGQPNVPNGLATGGLVPGNITWTGASSPTMSTSGGETTVTIKQNLPDATLYWNTFNIGKSTTVAFDQSKTGATPANSIAFNIIQDPSGLPSQILGKIVAPGQVYVINQNGIIFGGSSQVNVHTLVASSLPIDTYYITNGLLNNPDDQFLFSAISQPAVNLSPAFTPAREPPRRRWRCRGRGGSEHHCAGQCRERRRPRHADRSECHQ